MSTLIPSRPRGDRRYLDWAIAQARRLDPVIDPSVFDFLARRAIGRTRSRAEKRLQPSGRAALCMKLQQYCGPVMAKGLEDTAFFRYNRFVALNEVGGDPQRFGISAAAFHKANASRAEKWPHAMLATSTHDTKRGEDARARLAVVGRMPEEWAVTSRSGADCCEHAVAMSKATRLPDRNDEYLFYQLLVGSWPTELLEVRRWRSRRLSARS